MLPWDLVFSFSSTPHRSVTRALSRLIRESTSRDRGGRFLSSRMRPTTCSPTSTLERLTWSLSGRVRSRASARLPSLKSPPTSQVPAPLCKTGKQKWKQAPFPCKGCSLCHQCLSLMRLAGTTRRLHPPRAIIRMQVFFLLTSASSPLAEPKLLLPECKSYFPFAFPHLKHAVISQSWSHKLTRRKQRSAAEVSAAVCYAQRKMRHIPGTSMSPQRERLRAYYWWWKFFRLHVSFSF